MQLEQIIGRRIAEGRERHELSQAKLGQRLGDYLTNADGTRKELSRQAVWNAEQGKRAFTAAELVAFSDILSVTLEDLLEPYEEDGLKMPSGKEVGWLSLFNIPVTDQWDAVEEWLSDLKDNIKDQQDLVTYLEKAFIRAQRISE